MPERIFNPILAYFRPSEPLGGVFVTLQFILTAIAAWFSGLPPDTQILGAAMFFDYFTGAYAAKKEGRWSGKVGLDGLIKKVIIGTLILVLQWIAKLSGTGGPIVFALTFSVCLNEGKSTISNIRRIGIEVDNIFDAVLSRMKSTNDARLGPATPKPEEPSSKQENGHG